MIKIDFRDNFISVGDIGNIVRKIQSLLNKIGYDIDVDGIYGKKTESAVREFQRINNLLVDGIVGPYTMNKLLIKAGYNKAEAFINSQDYYSDTDYLIWTNTQKNIVYIFKGVNREWKLLKEFIASTGTKETPTIKGLYKTKVKGKSFGKYKGYIAKWYTQFYKDYLFHSIIFNLDGSIKDGRLGMNISDGCIRLSVDNAKYIYDFIPSGTTVFIN